MNGASFRRTVDIALTLPNADATRIAATGLSGGGWQTIVLSALDTRIALSNPVAGFSSYVTRSQWPDKDLGDSEQTPSDLASMADYTHLMALVAPRPLLLTHNARDTCCYRGDYALGALAQQATAAFTRAGTPAAFAYHLNHDAGHNYERDNREAFYRFLHAHLLGGAPGFDPTEPDVSGSIRPVADLAVPIPADNADFRSLARQTLAARRWCGHPGTRSAAFWQLHMGPWTVPATELAPTTARRTTLLLADAGRAAAAGDARRLLDAGSRVVAVDPFYFGESSLGPRDFLFGLLVSALGERPLGIQAGQVAAAARWLHERDGTPIDIDARGPRTSLIALVAAALEPGAIGRVRLHEDWRTLREVLDRNISAQQMPEMFAFGLLAEFDVPQIEALVAPRPVVRD